jgi:hypothetical protein
MTRTARVGFAVSTLGFAVFLVAFWGTLAHGPAAPPDPGAAGRAQPWMWAGLALAIAGTLLAGPAARAGRPRPRRWSP